MKIRAATDSDRAAIWEIFREVIASGETYPIEPDMFPMAILREMLGREYFVRIQPQPELEAELLPRPHDESPAAG